MLAVLWPRTFDSKGTTSVRYAKNVVAPLLCVFFLSCAGRAPLSLDVSASGLTPCPSSPNCVSSDADAGSQRVEPLTLAAPAEVAWRAAVELVTRMPRTRIVSETPEYVHAECRSALFGFVDDLELHLRPAAGAIAVRSASRLGYSDLGVNRRRVEKLRAALAARGVVRPRGE
jgi:uncharacterized protein (DUF1499 family)